MGRASFLLPALALLLPACGPDEALEVAAPSWAHVAPEQIAEARKFGVPVALCSRTDKVRWRPFVDAGVHYGSE